jgi:hypothetical protein
MFNQMFPHTPFGVFIQPDMLDILPLGSRDFKESEIKDGKDADKRQWLSEITLEVNNPDGIAVVTGVGLDNTLTS